MGADGWERFVSSVGVGRIVAALGGLYTGQASAVAIVLLRANAGLAEVVGRFGLIAALGIVLLYGGIRVPKMGLHADARPRIVNVDARRIRRHVHHRGDNAADLSERGR